MRLRENLLEHVRTPVLLALLIAFCVGGLLQLESRNDIRQWVGAPQRLTDEALLMDQLELITRIATNS